MARAIALTMTLQENPFVAAVYSAGNFSKLVAEFLYGSPKRINYTMSVMMALVFFSLLMNTVSKTVLQTCPI